MMEKLIADMKTYFLAAFFFAVLISFSCKKSGKDPDPVPPVNSTFAKGADVSWVTEMEAAGKKFYNSSGAEQECMAIMKGLGMNTVRLRVWVNPAAGWSCEGKEPRHARDDRLSLQRFVGGPW
jgi:arabinogalactan endo-1,4-beta-galactosidase